MEEVPIWLTDDDPSVSVLISDKIKQLGYY